MSDPKFNREKARRKDIVRARGGESLSSENWESGGTPINHDHEVRRKESELLTLLRLATLKLESICREKKLSDTQAARLTDQISALKEIKSEISRRELFAGIPEMLEARNWLESSALFVELLQSGHTIGAVGQRVDRAGALVRKSLSIRGEFRRCSFPDGELEFLRRFFPLYLHLRPPKSEIGTPALLRDYLRWFYLHEKI